MLEELAKEAIERVGCSEERGDNKYLLV